MMAWRGPRQAGDHSVVRKSLITYRRSSDRLHSGMDTAAWEVTVQHAVDSVLQRDSHQTWEESRTRHKSTLFL